MTVNKVTRLKTPRDRLAIAINHADEMRRISRAAGHRVSGPRRDQVQPLPLADQVAMFLHCERYVGRKL